MKIQQSHVDTYHEFHRKHHRHTFGSRARIPMSSQELAAQRKEWAAMERSDKKHGQGNFLELLHDQGRRDEMKANPKAVPARVTTVPRAAPRRRHAAGVRSSAASGDGNSDDSDPEHARPLLQNYLQLYNESSLATLLCVSKKTIQNLYSKTPWLLPPAISIPGARGPRWTVQCVQAWLNDRPTHTAKAAPKATTSRKVGRPRLALAVQGVQS
ncbi:hypothetical protein HAP94_08000 [Acidithiobacillus ferrivorans]|nr:hypothetical protein [Acidithiobacillus ferrivorans]